MSTPNCPLTLRIPKGTRLTHAELDNNFISLRNCINNLANSIENTYVTGSTFNYSTYDLTLFRNDGNTIVQNLAGLANDVFVTSGAYDPQTGTVVFTNSSGGTFSVSGFTTGFTNYYTTGVTLNDTTLVFDRNDSLSAYTIDLSSLGQTGSTLVPLIYNQSLAAPNTSVQPAFGSSTITSGSTYSSILGGRQNILTGSTYSSILGGRQNSILGTNTTHSNITGGFRNEISGNGRRSVVGGYGNRIIGTTSNPWGANGIPTGSYNVINNTDYSNIGGGYANNIYRSNYSTIGGGRGNYVYANVSFIGGGIGNSINDVGELSGSHVIVGGYGNQIDTNRDSSIVGGRNNQIIGTSYGNFSNHSFIGGGRNNQISGSSYSSIVGGRDNFTLKNNNTVVGGRDNQILLSSDSFIGGGYRNKIDANGTYGGDFGSHFIGGGYANNIIERFDGTYSYSNIIGGGRNNTLSGPYSVIVGGQENNNYGDRSSIVGGRQNSNSGSTSFIGGGRNNTNSGNDSFIGGGQNNTNSGDRGFIGGGYTNINLGSYSFIGGGRNNQISGSSHTSIIGGINNTIKNTLNTLSIFQTSTDFIGGGKDNTISGVTNNVNIDFLGFNTISSGYYNRIISDLTSTSFAFNVIGSGSGNLINNSLGSNIIGGFQNSIINTGAFNSIVGGNFNEIGRGDFGNSVDFKNGKTTFKFDNGRPSVGNFIGDGIYNIIRANAFSSIVGGFYNKIISPESYIGDNYGVSFIGGGSYNIISGTSEYSSIIGGTNNLINNLNNVHIIGSNITGTTANTTYVERFNIKTVTTGSTSRDILVRETTGEINTVPFSDISNLIDPYFNAGNVGTSINWNVSGNSTNYKITLTANTTLNVINYVDGDYGTIIVKQDGVGGRTLTFSSPSGTHYVVNGGGGSPTLTSNPNARDVLTFTYDGDGDEFYWTVGNDYT
jgi:hypothetical protein